MWRGTSGIPCPDPYPKGSIGCIGRFMPQLKVKDPDFKASLGWYQKWKRCHCISLRTKNNPCAVSSKQFRGKNSAVPSVCHTSTSVLRILLGQGSLTWKRPLSSVELSSEKSFGGENTSFTITLAVAADGKKLPPAVIFKGVQTPSDLAVTDSMRVSLHKKGMDGWMKPLNLSFCFAL